MSRARKAAIVESAVPDVASEIADALHAAAGALCQIAAGMHTETPGDQRNMAGVFYADANTRFKDVFRKMDPKVQRELEDYVLSICKGRRR